jgi:hypothetical protein
VALSTSAYPAATPTATSTAAVASNKRKKGGRPKGSTKKAKIESEENIKAAITTAAEELAAKMKASEKRLAPGTLAGIIKRAKQKHGVEDTVEIKQETIRSRVKRDNTSGDRLQTPMATVEPFLLAMCIAAKHNDIPFNQDKFLQVANSLIQGKPIEQEVIAFKKKHCGFEDTGNGAQLGRRYYELFKQRHAETINSKTPTWQDKKQKE